MGLKIKNRKGLNFKKPGSFFNSFRKPQTDKTKMGCLLYQNFVSSYQFGYFFLLQYNMQYHFPFNHLNTPKHNLVSKKQQQYQQKAKPGSYARLSMYPIVPLFLLCVTGHMLVNFFPEFSNFALHPIVL